MRVVLVTPEYRARPGVLERHVHRLAHGLARRGATVEVLTQDRDRRRPPGREPVGVSVRRFTPAGLWEHLRRRPATHDVVHLHGAHVGLGLAAMRAGVRPLVFTPHAPIEHLSRWSHARMLRAVVERARLTLCASRAEAELLRRELPFAAGRVQVVPNGVDVEDVRGARPFESLGQVVLTVGRLERHCGVARAIAALAGLDPEVRLVVVGDGPARRSLEAHARDLQVRSRVVFAGAAPDPVLYRWLRTAAVVLALAERQSSGVQLLEAVSAGAPVVATATPTNREIGVYLEDAAVRFVSPGGSPLEVADAVATAIGSRARSTTRSAVPSWDAVVDRTFELYEWLLAGRATSAPNRSPRWPRRTPSSDDADRVAAGG
jgi:glycosyltransferase involved in cell wall biosynthesis